jgi:hypothetical protein
MDAAVKWTNLSHREIARQMTEHGVVISKQQVKRLLYEEGYRRRKAQKGLPVLSIDTKKKEILGNFHRGGVIQTLETIETFDHDFSSFGEGTLIPHGLYDLGRNEGFVNLNTSHDTTELACDSIALWWERFGKERYPQAEELLLLCDGGGSNSARKYIFKEDLQKLANRLNLKIRVAHYPPYCSKYNPIEHRLFCHVTRATQGVIFHNLEIAKHYIAKTATSTGLKAFVSILDKVYQTGRTCLKSFKENMKIAFDAVLPKWNYTALPESS